MMQVISIQITLEELRQLVAEVVTNCLSEHKSIKNSDTGNLNYLSRKDVANCLRVNLKTVNEWTNSGKLKAHRIGRRVLYKTHEIDAALTGIKTKNK